MPPTEISLNSKRYRLSRKDGKSTGPVHWAWAERPSQPGDPSKVMQAEWRVDGPAFNSFEDTRFGQGVLSTDYNDNTDGRWSNLLMLAPAFTSIDCGTNDSSDTVADAHDSALATSANGGHFLYVARGTRSTKLLVGATSLTLETTGSFQLGSGAAGYVVTSLISTRNATGATEVSLGVGTGVYEVITTVANSTGSDTHSANNESKTARIFGQADDRVVGLGGADDERRVAGNILSGSVGMDASAWADIADIDGPQTLQFTGFAMDRQLMVLGTSKGPYIINRQFGRFFPVRDDMAHNTENCRHMTQWFDPVNLSIPLVDSLRRMVNGSSESWGIETFTRNTSPVQGYVTGQDGNARWFRTAYYDVVTDDSWIVDWRVTRYGDPEPDHVMQPFVVGHFTDTNVRFMRWLDTVDGTMTNPHWVMGYNDDIAIQRAGRSAYLTNEYKDANYVFQTSGAWYGTEMRRHDNMVMDFEFVELTSDDCDSNDTVTIGFSTNGGTSYTSLTGTLDYSGGSTLNGVINTDGYQKVLLVDNSNVPLATATGRVFKPKLTLAAGAATASPKVIGKLRLTYRLRPAMVRVYQFSIVVEADRNRSAREVREDLFTELGSGPVKLETDFDGSAVYVRIENVAVAYTSEADVITASVVATEWLTTA